MSIIQSQNSFPSPMFQVMDHEGKIVDEEQFKKVNDKQLVEFYEWMIKIRIADTRCGNLQRTGKMGTYASVYGQEACQVGVGLALEKKDWLVPTFRETGMMWTYGVPLDKIFLYWMGNEIGSAHPEDVNCMPIAITVGGHLPHATGLAWANKLKKSDSVVLCSFGDGATSEGDFHAALNFAGRFNTANVFFCQNNQYAISTNRKLQTASKTIAQKAFAYGVRAIYLDANDVVATYIAVKEAIESARKGEGPVLIEAVTYRLGDHTTSDNAKLYRDEKEVEEMKNKEPVLRLRKYLEGKKLWDEKKQSTLEEIAAKEVDKITDKALSHPKLDPKNMFTKLYAEMPETLKKQYEEFGEEMKEMKSEK